MRGTRGEVKFGSLKFALTPVVSVDGDARFLDGCIDTVVDSEFFRSSRTSGRFLKRFCSGRQMRPYIASRDSLTARLCEHLSAAILLFARPASVSLPSIASFRMSFPVGLAGFSSAKKTKASIAR